VSGHLQANNVYETQPAKMAAFEGHYKTGAGDLSLFAIPNSDKQRLDYNLAIPGGLSFLIHEDFTEPVVGLDKFHPKDRPPVAIPFFTYHLMVGLGTLFIALTLLASFFRWRGTLFHKRWLMWIFVFAVLGAVAANQAGWVAAEVGRQPWIVHPPMWDQWNGDGMIETGADGFVQYPKAEVTMPDGSTKQATQGLRTTDGVSQAIHANQVLGSIIMFGLIYLLLGAVWLFVLNNKIQHGPPPLREEAEGEPARRDHGYLDAAAQRATHKESDETS
jgi:cytochrome d ubiquinol oxidase subunit I